MTTRTYKLPFPPSVNHGHGNGRRRRYLTKQADTFRENVLAEVMSHGLRPRLEGRLAFTMHLFGRSRASYDIDNYIKHTLDALQAAGVFVNDKQFDQEHLYRCDIAPPGHVIVKIETLNS